MKYLSLAFVKFAYLFHWMRAMYDRFMDYLASQPSRALWRAWLWLVLYLCIPAFLLGYWSKEVPRKRVTVKRSIEF